MINYTLINKLSFKTAATVVFLTAGMVFCLPLLMSQVQYSRQASSAINASSSNGWNSVKGEYITLYYGPGVDLDKVERRLRRRHLFFGGRRATNNMGDAQRVVYRLDVLFDQVRTTLEMRTQGLNVRVKIFASQSELDREHYKIAMRNESFKAFYIYRYNTIYTSEEGISDSVMVHEMGHAVTDNYFNVIPPPKLREMIASYLESHLDD